jgi:hypothetical protein
MGVLSWLFRDQGASRTHFDVAVKCHNCGALTYAQVPLGHRVIGVCVKCVNCQVVGSVTAAHTLIAIPEPTGASTGNKEE